MYITIDMGGTGRLRTNVLWGTLVDWCGFLPEAEKEIETQTCQAHRHFAGGAKPRISSSDHNRVRPTPSLTNYRRYFDEHQSR